MSKQTAPSTEVAAMGSMASALLKALPEGKLQNPTVVKASAFKKVAGFAVVIPKDHNHPTVINAFVADFQSRTFKCDPLLTDAGCRAISYGLIPGAKYRVELYEHEGATSSEAVAFLAELGSLFLGAQGLATIARLNAHELLWKRTGAVVSFGEATKSSEFAAVFMSRAEFTIARNSECAWPKNYKMMRVTRIS